MDYSNADNVIAFCLYLMNKMRGNLIKISHALFLVGLTGWIGLELFLDR